MSCAAGLRPFNLTKRKKENTHWKYDYLWHGSRWEIVRRVEMTELALTTLTRSWKAADVTSFWSCCRKCQLCEGQWENGLPKIWKVNSRAAPRVRCNLVCHGRRDEGLALGTGHHWQALKVIQATPKMTQVDPEIVFKFHLINNTQEGMFALQ